MTTTTLPGTTATARAFGGSVFGKTLYDNRRVLTVWALATGLLAIGYGSFYPQVTEQQTAQIPEAMRGFGFEDISSAAGYLQGPVFGLLVPLLATFYGAATGARMVSADEESGYLDLLLAHPVGRTRLLLHRFAALAAGAVVISVAVLLAMLAIRPAWTRSAPAPSPPRLSTWPCSRSSSARWRPASARPPAGAGRSCSASAAASASPCSP
jgi:ABC-2 type transport system permease protein